MIIKMSHFEFAEQLSVQLKLQEGQALPENKQNHIPLLFMTSFYFPASANQVPSIRMNLFITEGLSPFLIGQTFSSQN